jgi:hypothetical protein
MKTKSQEKLLINVLAFLTDPEQVDGVGNLIVEMDGSAEWGFYIRRMAEEGVAFLFYYYLRKHRLTGLIPKEINQALGYLYFENLRRNIMVSKALNRLFTHLNAGKIPFIVMKGIALAELFYPGLATRGMSDADVLVKKEDVYKVDRSLTELGYAASDSSVEDALRNPAGYLSSLDYRSDEEPFPNIHLHWHPVNTSVPAYMFSGNIDLERLWQMAIQTRVADADVRVFRPEHQLIYLCEHGLRINHSFDRLILIYDIFYAINTPAYRIDWRVVVQEARRFKLERFVFTGLAVVKHYTSAAVPEEIMTELRTAFFLSLFDRGFLHLQLHGRRLRGSSFLLYFAMNEGVFAKTVFLFRTLFPPRRILLQRSYAKGARFNASWYFRRIGEVFSHGFSVLRRL